MSILLYPSVAKIKRNGVFENLPGFVPETGAIATQQMIATAESSATAQYVHNKGEYFRLNDTLYQAIVKINVGDSIVVGTNCEVAVLGNDVTHIANSIAEYELGIATSAHATGEYFMVGETMYVATADIQVGDSISTSTNCRLAVVGDELSGLKTALNELSITNINGVERVGVEYNEIAKATECTSENFVSANAPAVIYGYTVDTFGESYTIKTGASFALLKLDVSEGDVIRQKLAPYWYNTQQTVYYLWLHQGNTWVRKTLGFEGRAADISASDLKTNGYTIPSGVDQILIHLFRTYYLSNGTQIKAGVSEQSDPGFVEEIITLNQSATYTEYDDLEEAPVYVPSSTDEHYRISADLRIDRYEEILGEIEATLAEIIGGTP